MHRAFSRCRLQLAVLIAAYAAGLPAAESPPAPSVPPNAQAVKDLVAQLESSDFDAREQATQALVDTGPAADAVLAQAVEGAGPETRTRIEKIRLGWTMAREQAAKEAWTARFQGLIPGTEMIREVYKAIAEVTTELPVAHSDSSSAEKPLECTESHDLDDDWYLQIDYRRDAVAKPWKLWKWKISGFPDLRPRMKQEIYPLVRAIHASSGFSGDVFAPHTLLRAANLLQGAGKSRALEALQTYFELCRDGALLPFRFRDDRILALTRLLFVRAADEEPLRAPCLGSHGLPTESGPQFPLLLSQGVPFMVVSGYVLDGKAESPISYLDYCEANGVFRATPIVPEHSPLEAAEALFASDLWAQIFTKDGKKQEDSSHRAMVRAQALRALGALEPNDVDSSDDKSWANAVQRIKALPIRWDTKEGRFVKQTPP